MNATDYIMALWAVDESGRSEVERMLSDNLNKDMLDLGFLNPAGERPDDHDGAYASVC